MQWMKSFNDVLRENNKKAQGGNAASYGTKDARRSTLDLGFRLLHKKLGYKLTDVRQFKEKHMLALGHYWEDLGRSPKTIQNRISNFRVFSDWIGKKGMIRDSRYYVKNPASVETSMIAKVDKSWRGNGINITDKIKQISLKDERAAIQLGLMAAFGLRAKEAFLLKPHLADKKHYLAVKWGTKGNRPRYVQIETEAQIAVLELAKKAIKNKTHSMIPKSYTYESWYNHYFYVVRKAGIKKDGDGVTSHGLRHERLQEIYKGITGHDCPVRGNKGRVDSELNHIARLEVAEVAGHSRASISKAYLG